MKGYDFSVPTAYSGGSVPGTLYLPDGHGRIPVCYICPDTASARDGPYGILKAVAEGLTAGGTAAVLYDTAGNGERISETAAFLDQDTYDLDRVRRYVTAALGEKMGKETLAGYGAGALTAAWYASDKRNIERLVLITPVLAWKNGLDSVHRKMANRECLNIKCRKEKDYIDELEYRSSPVSDGMNAALHQLASGFTGEIRAVIGLKDSPGTAEMLKVFEPYYSRRGEGLSLETVPEVGHREGLEVPELKMRLAGLAAETVLRDTREHEKDEEFEEYTR